MGRCQNCEFYKVIDDGNEMYNKCMRTSKVGKKITWSMYVYKPLNSLGCFVQDEEENKSRWEKINKWAETHKEPYWCPLKKEDEKNGENKTNQ